MNTSCPLQSFPPYLLLLVVANLLNDWKTSACPVPLMLKFLQSALRILLVGAASILLALAGILLSAIAYVRELNRLNARRSEGEEHRKPSSSVRGARTVPPNHKPRPRRVPSTHPAPIQSIGSTGQLPSSISSWPAESLQARSISPRRRSAPKQHQVMGMTIAEEGSSIDGVVEAIEGPDIPRPAQPELDPSPPPGQQVPTSIYSDSSVGNRSADPSETSLSSQEQPRAHGRGVFQKIRGHHAQMREQCLNRAQSLPMPKTKPTRPARRTDPYQAPFFFPTPMSPQAGTYLQEVISERQGLSPPQGVVTESPLSSPKSLNLQVLPEPGPATLPPGTPAVSSAVSPAASEATVQPSRPPMKTRWSWHNPLRHHTPGSSLESPSSRSKAENGNASELKEGFRGFKLGHHRRRHGFGSDDTTTSRTQTFA